MKILIIEDEHVIATNLKFILERNHYECDIAIDGEEGIEKIKNWSPDLVISDLKLPKKDGLTIIKELRNNLKMVNLPFIFLTARADEKDKREGINLGADDYITKPFAIKELLETIKKRLELSELKNSVLKNTAAEETVHLFNSISTNEYLTPLKNIIHFSELISSKLEHYADEEKKILLNNIHTSAQKLHHSISKLFCLICLKENKQPWQVKGGQTILLQHLIQTLAEEFSQTNKFPEIIIESSPEETVLINYYQNDAVLMIGELIENIKKFTTGHQPASFSISANNEHVTLIAKNECNKMDNVTPSTKKNLDNKSWTGEGLGLYLLNNWANTIGGTLSLDRHNNYFIVELTLPKNLN